MTPRGPFDLTNQNRYFNGWPTLPDHPETVVMAFPVEGWRGSAAVTLRQRGDEVDVRVIAPPEIAEKAESQALAAISLDVDGTPWAGLGERNALLGELQQQHRFLRPTMFHSPYEAAAAFVIGHRISIVQTRRIRQRLAEQSGATIEVDGAPFAAFPDPEALLRIDHIDGVADTKIPRLHGVARAALDGLLDRDALRAIDTAEALAELQTIPGIGPFFAEAILYRGVGVPTGITHDPMSLEAVQRAFDLPEVPSVADADRLTDEWQPLRMWAMVLLHVHLREENQGPGRRPR
ncbi:MAG: DNA-3-methyladenine glycosylase [Microbacteriaceae bacterium]|nr:DNA-3-methyladenine glycosylase [Microbacteriaceae bacterium]